MVKLKLERKNSPIFVYYFAKQLKTILPAYTHEVGKAKIKIFKILKFTTQRISYPNNMKKLPYIFTAFFLFLTLLASCTGEKTAEEELSDKKNKDKDKSSGSAISSEVIGDIVKAIPTPLEISFFISTLDIKYDKSVLNQTEHAKKYNSQHQLALNLGVYSTDLGYTNVYEQSQDAFLYLSAVNEMAKALNVDKFFDFETIKKLASARSNLDTLLLITTENLNNINDHLQQKNRPDLTILIITGGWLESLYLTCEVARKSPNDVLKTRIGEQKLILEQIMLLLSFYDAQNKDIRALIAEFQKLTKIYANVKITYTSEPTVTKEVNGQLVTEGGTKSEIKLENKDFEAVLETVRDIRKTITTPK